MAMKNPLVAAGFAATTAVVAVSMVACGSSNTSSTSSTPSSSAAAKSTAVSSATAQPADYTALLIKAGDITSPGDTFTMQPPTQNPNGAAGVAALFANQNDTREIGDTILVLPDASAAATALEGAKAALGNSVSGGTPQPVAIGTGGTTVAGTSPDGTKSVTVLLFTEGKAFVTLEFDGAPNDPVPPEGVADVGGKQDEAIKSGLPG